MPFPAAIDNTIRKAFVTCPMLAKRAYVDNLRANDEKTVDLHFGGAFAKGIEVARKHYYMQGMTASESVDVGLTAAFEAYGDYTPPEKHVKTKVRLLDAIEYYFEQWPLSNSGLVPVEHGIELGFTFPLPFTHPDTGEVLLYAGHFDMAARDENGRIYVVDEKTTSRLSSTWDMQWDLDTQMTGYLYWMRRAFPDDERQALIRGIEIGARSFGHVEIPVMRPDWMLDRWAEQLLRDVDRMLRAYDSGTWDQALHSNACVQYQRRCDYHMLCMSPSPERMIADNYHNVVWNPLTK